MKNNFVNVKFNDEWYEPILEGRKTQTMRIPPSRWNVEEDDLVVANFKGKPKKVLLEITKIGYKNFGSINDEDAKREGLTSVDELKKVLQEIYNEYALYDFNRIYYYQFRVAGEVDVEVK